MLTRFVCFFYFYNAFNLYSFKGQNGRILLFECSYFIACFRNINLQLFYMCDHNNSNSIYIKILMYMSNIFNYTKYPQYKT